MAWTTTQLLAQMRRVASASTVATAEGYTDADLLVHADTALQSYLGPLVANARDEHAVSTVDVAVAANQSTVRLPPRVASGRLRNVTLSTSSGEYVTVPRLEPEDVAVRGFGAPRGPPSIVVVVQAGWLRILPAPNAALTLRLSYVRAPSAFALVSTCTLATALTAATPSITVTHTGTLAAGDWDFILLGNGDSLGDSVTAGTRLSGSTTFAAASMSPLFANVQAECTRYVSEGLYLCPAKTSCVVPLPDSMSPILAHRAAALHMDAIGDVDGAARANRAAEAMEEQTLALLSERIEGAPQVVRPSMHARGGGFWGRW